MSSGLIAIPNDHHQRMLRIPVKRTTTTIVLHLLAGHLKSAAKLSFARGPTTDGSVGWSPRRWSLSRELGGDLTDDRDQKLDVGRAGAPLTIAGRSAT